MLQVYYNYNNQDTEAAAAANQGYYDYGYNNQGYQYQGGQNAGTGIFGNLAQERQGGLELILSAPVVFTAFVAALFGGNMRKYQYLKNDKIDLYFYVFTNTKMLKKYLLCNKRRKIYSFTFNLIISSIHILKCYL